MCGQCQCVNTGPYFGTFCDLCSGDPVCRKETCNPNLSNAQCAKCAVEFLETFNKEEVSDSELFDTDFIHEAIVNGTLPMGTALSSLDSATSETAIFLPMRFAVKCNNCSPLVVIRQTMLVDYEIMSKEVIDDNLYIATLINSCRNMSNFTDM